MQTKLPKPIVVKLPPELMCETELVNGHLWLDKLKCHLGSNHVTLYVTIHTWLGIEIALHNQIDIAEHLEGLDGHANCAEHHMILLKSRANASRQRLSA